MEKVPHNMDCNQKTFGHCIVNWKVENYCLATCKEGWVISSAEFYVGGPHTTGWKMILNSKSNILGVSFITWTLQRLESDTGPDTVRTDWKVCFLDPKENAYCVRNCEYNFLKNEIYKMDLGSEDFPPFEPDTLNIRCQMIVHHEESDKKFSKASDTGLRSLSQDLIYLYRLSRYYDVSFKVSGMEIKAHRAILHARNANIAKLLDRQPNKREIELAIVNYEALEKTLSYMYSGNLEFVIANPSISLYECVTFFSIDDLKAHYAPDEKNLHNTIDVQELVFVWLIRDFSTRIEDFILSPYLNKNEAETWQLCFYPQGVDHDVKHVGISAQMVEGNRPLRVCAEFAIIDQNREFFCSKRINKFTTENEVLICENFAEREYLENSSLTTDDTLRIVFKLRISRGNQTASQVSNIFSFTSSNAKQESYDILSKDMQRMYESGEFKDIVLVAEGKYFKVHKCVLAARSEKFSNMFSQLKDDQTTVMIPDLNQNILQILITYIYCGILIDFDIKEVPHVYEAAESFAISPLKEKCSQILQTNLEIHSVCDLLIFADARNDKELKMSTLKFISQNIQAVQEQPAWSMLNEMRPFLCAEVHELEQNNMEIVEHISEVPRD